MKVQDRFLNYVKFDTQSVPDQDVIPSSEKQKDLALYLVGEMKSIGINDVFMDEYGYVYGTIPSNTDKTGYGFYSSYGHITRYAGK